MQDITYVRWHYAHWLGGKIARRPAIEQALFINLQAMCMKDGGSYAMTDLNVIDMADRLDVEPEQVREAMDALRVREIIMLDDDGVTVSIKFLSQQVRSIKSVSEARRMAARARWEQENPTGRGHANASGANANASGDRIAPDSDSVIGVTDANASEPDANASRGDANAPKSHAKKCKPMQPLSEKEKEKEKESIPSSRIDPARRAEVLSQWNALAKPRGLPLLRRVTDKLWTHYKRRIGEEPDFWILLEPELECLDEFVYEGSWFDFHWIVKSEDNLQKLLAGKYRKKNGQRQQSLDPQTENMLEYMRRTAE